MIVGILSDVIYEYISGLAVFTKRLIDRLKDNVEKIIVFTAGTKQKVIDKGNVRIYYIKGVYFKKFNLSIGVYPLNMIKEILKEEKVDVLHCQTPALMGISAVLYARKLDIPVIHTYHFQPDNLTRHYHLQLKFIKNILYKYGYWIYNLCDYITCPSKHALDELYGNILKETTPASIISNGINSNYFIPQNGKTTKMVLFIGRIMIEKSIDTLIMASEIVKNKYPDYKFVIAGTGYHLQELKRIANQFNPDVIFTGMVSDKEILNLLQACEIFVLPSESELQGICLLEAMSCSKPTIASDSKYSAAKELANLTFPHRNYEELAKKIIYLIENKEIAHKYGKENREKVINEHDYSKVTSEYIKLYEDVIKLKNNHNNNEGKKPVFREIDSSQKGDSIYLKMKHQKNKKNILNVLKHGIEVKYLGKPWPMWIDFRITYRCNLRCWYCDMPSVKVEEMSTDEIKKVIDKINAPERVILLTGGEPLVRNDIGEVVKYFVDHSDLEVRFNTNLILLKKKYDEIKDCNGFFFSLDGTKETHEKNKGIGSWKGVQEGLEILHKEKRGKISMTVITSNTTLDDIEFVLDTCSKYEILPAFQIVRHYNLSKQSKEIQPNMENAIKIFEYLLEQRKKGFNMMNSKKGLEGQIQLANGTLDAKCYSGKLLCSIDSDGMVGLCFSRPRNEQFLNIAKNDISFMDAIEALARIKPHNIRCSDCTCMAPIEFSLCNFINMDVLIDTYKSERQYQRLEKEYINRIQKTVV